MKNTAFLIFWISTCLFSQSFAQQKQDEKDIYMQIGEEEVSNYLNSYLEPLFKGIGYGFTSGWYNTAETHETWGFDISLSVNTAFIPRIEETFRFKNEFYDKIQLASGSEAELPTIFGPLSKSDRPELSIRDENDKELVRVNAPPGIIDFKERFGVNAVPVPMFQAGLGVLYHTDLKLRVLPKLNFDGTSVSMFGLGVQHDVAQWFDQLAVRDISIALFGGFNRLKVTTDLSYSDPETKDNHGIFRINGFNLQAIASKEYIDFITIFGGIGYSRAGSRTQIFGSYPIGNEYRELPDDPIDFKYGNSSMNLTMGITVKLLLVTVTASHTIQKYQTTSLGIGLSIK